MFATRFLVAQQQGYFTEVHFRHDTVHGGLLACGELPVFSTMRLPTFLLFLAFFPCALLRAEPVSLFDGKTLEGWDFDPKIWRVEDGVITGGSTTEKITANHFIATKKSFQNFELKLKIKCSGDPKTGMINSGIQIRSLRSPGGTHMSGYQVDCGDKWFGKIYDEYRRNNVIAEPIDATALDKAVDVFGWNEYRIRAEGPRIQVWINGVAALDYTEQDKNIALDGQIAPQVHSGGMCLVQVKDVTVEELPPTPGAPTWESLGGVEAARKLVAPPPKPKQAEAAPAKTKRDISYNDVQGVSRTAEEQQKLFHLPEGYEIELVVKESAGLGKFVSVYFDQRGRMWTQTALEYPVDSNENPAAAEAVYAGKGKDKVLVYPQESVNGPIPAGGLTNATVFADGLAIPLGILPWGNGDTCYVQHGHDLKLYKDTNGDGKADTFDVVLTGFGVQDSHLFPHQFTRAPGGWIWMAQGLFNNSKVHKPGSDVVVDWPKCSMARMRPDGSQFEVTSTGPNNIWGLVITGEGEAFIQEANDYGYPVMPFHEHAYYPGGMEALKKSYQPDFPPAAEFRMGGTGLSGLALIEFGPLKSSLVAVQQGNAPSAPTPAAHVMAVANPITSKVQTIAMHRDDAYWKLEQLADLITCDDPFFRPVGMTNGPDGCIYITDWYNKIISHNEVPRAHPDRDKTRGRIWRVKPKATGARTSESAALDPSPSAPEVPKTSDTAKARSGVLPRAAGSEACAPGSIPDFTKMSTAELIAMLGTEPVAQAHLAWQTLIDRNDANLSPLLRTLAQKESAAASLRIQALWCLDGLGMPMGATRPSTAASTSPSATIRAEEQRMLGNGLVFEAANGSSLSGDTFFKAAVNDPSPIVRQEAIKQLDKCLRCATADEAQMHLVGTILAFAKPSLPGRLGQSSRGPKQIPIREAYDREFERFLVRMFLERH
ncbi:MAG TPA: family 16 glycoside hydrolase, partial [Prosthecobacter sp.]